MSAKKRVSRKKLLKEPDEFITSWAKIFNYLEENRRIFYITAIAIITLSACSIVFSYFYFKHQEKAKVEISQAIDDYNLAENDEEKLLEVLDDFNSILKAYPLTNQRKIALLYRGHTLYYLGRYTEALSDYEKAKNKFDTPMKKRVIENIGFCQEKLEDYESASETYFKILDDKNESSYINLIRSFKKEGKGDEVKKYSKEFMKLFPDSVYASLIEANIDDEDKADDKVEEELEEK